MTFQRSRPEAALAVFLVLAGAAAVEGQESTERFSLRDCEIQVAEGLPRYVHRAAEELAAVMDRFGGRRPTIRVLPEPRPDRRLDPIITIGLMPIEALEVESPPKEDQSPERFVIRTVRLSRTGRAERIRIGAAGPEGLKFGVLELIRHLRVGEGDVRLDWPLEIVKQPAWRLRSMYAHLHWSYERPYALRSWTLDDWKRYVDLLAHLGFNGIQMWPMMELLPHPLSGPDQGYLNKHAEIVDYAHREWGMKAFIGSCPNNITEDARGVPIEKREYFDFEKLLDPGVPENLAKILEFRSDLYHTVPDADGYWVIDHDPGGWKGSPSSAFVDLLAGHRRLIERYGERPKQQPLIYWMWMSWGVDDPPQNYRATLRDMLRRVPEPWRIHVCHQQHLDAMKEMQLADRAIWFPYNLVEDEPSGPLTDLRFAAIRESLERAKSYGLRDVQGNAQTPLVQLPNLMVLSYVAWGGEPDGETEAILHALADRLVSREPETLVAAWKTLTEPEAGRSLDLADRVAALAKDESAAGVFRVILGDWQQRILEDLATMLRIHGHALRFEQAAAAGDPAPATQALQRYLEAVAGWLDRTGYHNRRIVCHRPYVDPVTSGIETLKARLGEEQTMVKMVQPAQAAASVRYSPDTVTAIVETLLGRRK